MTSDGTAAALADLPEWVPERARLYIAHTENGLPIRALARGSEVHASTVLRQIRRLEQRRDDPLVDGALKTLSAVLPNATANDGRSPMDKCTNGAVPFNGLPDMAKVSDEGLRVLRRLAEPGAVLAVASDMEMGVVVREIGDGETLRTAVVTREIAQVMALKEWIACSDPDARIARYHITSQGRAALKDLMAADENRALSLSDMEGLKRDAKCPRTWLAVDTDDAKLSLLRNGFVESPLIGLARRRDRDGKPFLRRDHLAAGEQLREDFEIAQMGGAGAGPNWLDYVGGIPPQGPDLPKASRAAHDRVAQALAELGPGLGDVALRACCYLEGMEVLERHMGWSARSGKIVLRIALQRLIRHYARTQGRFGPMIG